MAGSHSYFLSASSAYRLQEQVNKLYEDELDLTTYRAAIIDWARHLRDRYEIIPRLSRLRALYREFYGERAVLYRAIELSLDLEARHLILDPRDYQIRTLRIKNAVLQAAAELGGA